MNNSWILGLDASTPRSCLVLGYVDAHGGHTLVAHDDEIDPADGASSRLVARIQRLLERAGITASELAFVGCGRGPGTFTGTRVALATAKGLALAVPCPLLPVSTLAAMAFSLPQNGSEDAVVLATLDARRSEIYGALLRCRTTPTVTIESLGVEHVAPMATVVQETEATSCLPTGVIGPGAVAYASELPANWPAPVALAGPAPEGLWLALVAAHTAGAACDPSLVDAVYLRKSYAELGLNQPKRPFVKSPFV